MRKEGAFLMGLGTGLALGVIFAPHSGKEFRNLITRRAQESLDDLVATGERVGSQLKESVTTRIDQFVEIVDAAKEGYEGSKAWHAEIEGVQKLESGG